MTRFRVRTGVTLVELLVVLLVAGIALGLVGAISLRQQGILGDLADRSALQTQLRDAGAVLPIDLRGAAPALGDLRDARDTAVEFRATIATAVVCDTSATGILLAPATDSVTTLATVLTPISPGDTAWLLSAHDSILAWQPFRVASSTTARAGACAAGGPALTPSERAIARTAIALDSVGPATAVIGMPIRFTRAVRYSLYRASDGAWYLGERDWNTAAGRFNTIQPVSGPFLSPSQGGLVLRYADTTGRELATPVADPRSIAFVRVELRGEPHHAPRVLSSRGAVRSVDSALVTILLRNR